MRIAAQTGKIALALALFVGQKALEGEPAAGQSRAGQRADRSACARQRHDAHALPRAVGDELLARVGDGGRTRVGDKRAAFPRLQRGEDMYARRARVMLVIGHARLLQPQQRQQPAGVARVLRRDQVHARQHDAGALGDVGHIPDRRGHDVEDARLDEAFAFRILRHHPFFFARL